jgi:hypothetical protein
MGLDASRVESLRAQARHYRAKLERYRSKTYGPGETSAQRLRELEQRAAAADERLLTAEREHAAR